MKTTKAAKTTKPVKLFWRPDDVPADIAPFLQCIGEDYALYPSEHTRSGIRLKFEKIDDPGRYQIIRRRQDATIYYSELNTLGRALGALLSGTVPAEQTCSEKSDFKSLGFMLDCSRNFVVTVTHFKKWLRRATLLGYNQAMLYTEDTYQLDGEPFFGYLRGAYTKSELIEIDNYAATLGIEMVACIQTLGHLIHALQWPAYANLQDSPSVLLTHEPRTYDLINKMLAHWAEVFRSRRIHIGMDEAVEIGQGKIWQELGSPKPAELFFKHLNKVAALCDQHGLRPMIWSDMVFWLDNPERKLGEIYYDTATPAPKHFAQYLPKNMQMVFWDYSHDDPKTYTTLIHKHLELGYNPVMASGCHIWGRFWHDAKNTTEPRVTACVKSCKEAGVNELLMTLWGNGAEMDIDSSWAGLAFAAEQVFATSFNQTAFEKRYRAICKAEYQASVEAALDIWWNDPPITATTIFWDDPIYAMLLRSLYERDANLLPKLARYYRNLAQRLLRWDNNTEAGNQRHIRNIAEFLGRKASLHYHLQRTSQKKSSLELQKAREEALALQQLLKQIAQSYRSNWLRQCKPFGMEIIQIRLGGMQLRLNELLIRLNDMAKTKSWLLDEWKITYLPYTRRRGSNYNNLSSVSKLL